MSVKLGRFQIWRGENMIDSEEKQYPIVSESKSFSGLLKGIGQISTQAKIAIGIGNFI